MTAYDTNGRNPIPVTSVINHNIRPVSPERKNLEIISPEISNTSLNLPSLDKETRKVINMMCNVKPKENIGETELTVNIVYNYCKF